MKYIWLTETIFDEVVEGIAVAVVGELIIAIARRRKFLQALWSNAGEVAGEISVVGEDHRVSRHEAEDQRLLPHLSA